MDSRDPNGHAYQSRALLDMTVVPIVMSLESVRKLLPEHAELDIDALEGVPSQYHPVIVEMWRVDDGRIEVGGLDLNSWAERAGSAIGGLWGAGFGLMEAAARSRETTGPSLLDNATASGARFADLMGRAAGNLSKWGARTLGSYHEVIVWVPGVRRGSLSGSLVLGMRTDSHVARWGERALGYGYGKQMATISREGFERYLVCSPDEGTLIEAHLRRRPVAWQSFKQLPAIGTIWRWLRQPLLGLRGLGKTLVVSHLDRSLEDPATTFALASLRVTLGPGMPISLAACDILPASVRRPWGSFLARRVPVRLSFPYLDKG